MQLSKEQTFQLLYNNKKLVSNKYKYKYTTKFKWWCLDCLKEIYVSYKQYGINSIFCSSCYPKKTKFPTIVQAHYMRVLKEKQIALVESQIK